MLQPASLNPGYGDLAAHWALTPATDQQLAWGLRMTAGILSYLGAAVALASAWFSALEPRHPAQRRGLA